MYTELLSQYPHTLGNVHTDKCFWIFPHKVPDKLTLGLPYAYKILGLDPPLPIRGLYIEPLGVIEVGEFGEKGNYSSLFPQLFILESTYIFPFGAHIGVLP